MNLKELQKANLEHSILIEMQKNRVVKNSMSPMTKVEKEIAKLVNLTLSKKGENRFSAEDKINVKNLVDKLFKNMTDNVVKENAQLGQYELDYSISLNNKVSRTLVKPKESITKLAKANLPDTSLLNTKSKKELLVQKNHLTNLMTRQLNTLIKNKTPASAIAQTLTKSLKSRNGWLDNIIRTASASTVNQANVIGSEYAGVKEYICHAVLDEKTSSECYAANGKIYSVREAKSVLPRHQNCRCSMIAVYKENQTKLSTYNELIKDVKNKEYLTDAEAESFNISKDKLMSINEMKKLEAFQ